MDASRLLAIALALLMAMVTLSACSDEGGNAQSKGGVPTVATSSYALAYVAQAVGGDEVVVEDLSSTSGHAHNLELSPAQVQRLGSSDLVLYLSQGFQPAVEEAIGQSGVASIDVLSAVPEDQLIAGDPHVWLDPVLMSYIGQEVADVLAEANPPQAEYYQKKAEELTKKLNEVEAKYDAALADCEGETLLTTHEAFGYMAKRYGLQQVGVTGIDPEAEPSPAKLMELKGLVEERGVTTIFIETLTSEHHESHMTETLGVKALPLDTIEVQVDSDEDLIDVYTSNLESLKEGLACAS